MTILRYIAAALSFIFLTGGAAISFEGFTATVRVESGSLYDYVVIGEHPQATDGFDNAYDTISPGNLNADMGQPYISAIILHPDWKMKEFRGDIRKPGKSKEWRVTVSSSLPKGAPLAVSLQKERTTLPKSVQLTVRGAKSGEQTDLRLASYALPAPGPGSKSEIVITAEQP